MSDAMLDHPGAKPTVKTPLRGQLIHTMYHYFKLMGYTDIKARVMPYETPNLLPGKIQHHCPDLTCIQNDEKSTPILLDVVTGEELMSKDSKNRWETFKFYVDATKGKFELHFAVPQWDEASAEMGSLDKRLRTKLFGLGISYNRIWSL